MLGELFSGQTIFFSVPALVGTFFFILRLVMSMMGLGENNVPTMPFVCGKKLL